MGFSIASDGLVSINHETNHFAITTSTIGKSPCITNSKCRKYPIDIHSVYFRPKNPKNAKSEGDNCPFIYAWKRKHPKLYITRYSLKEMRLDFYIILDKLVLNIIKNQSIDFIVPLPSKHGLALNLAIRLQRRLPNSVILFDIFLKKPNSEILEEIYDLDIIHSDKTQLTNAISRANALNRNFSISDIPTNLRGYLDPLKINTALLKNGTYLLVDDLFATGATLLNAKDKLLNLNSNINVLGSVIFGPYNNRIR